MTVPVLGVGLTVHVPAKDGGVPNDGSKGIVTAPNVERILVHVPVTPVAKPEPDRVTSVPPGPKLGDTAIRGTTAKAGLFVAGSSPGVPVTVSV